MLTGTPLQNNLGELWSLLHFLMPQVFTPTTVSSFKNAFSLSDGLYDQKFLLASQKLLELIMLRRTKESVKTELSVPPREELTLYVPLSPPFSDGGTSASSLALNRKPSRRFFHLRTTRTPTRAPTSSTLWNRAKTVGSR